MVRRTMNWTFVDDTLLCVHGLSSPDPKEWAAFIAESLSEGARMGQVLVFADVGLSPLQRKEVADSVAKAGTPERCPCWRRGPPRAAAPKTHLNGSRPASRLAATSGPRERSSYVPPYY